MINKEQYQHLNKNELKNELLYACRYGYLDIVQYLLTSPDLKKHVDIHCKTPSGWDALIFACINGHLDIAQYLLTSPELKEHANIYHKNNDGDNALMFACINGHLNIIQYLIIDMNMKKKKKTIKWLQGNNKDNMVYSNVLILIESRNYSRNLHQQLDNSINSENINKKKVAGIKI